MTEKIICPECGKPITQIAAIRKYFYLIWDGKKYVNYDGNVMMVYMDVGCGRQIGGTDKRGESWGVIPNA